MWPNERIADAHAAVGQLIYRGKFDDYMYDLHDRTGGAAADPNAVSLYDKPQVKLTNSSFAYLTHDFVPVAGAPGEGRLFALELKSTADLIGDCYIDFRFASDGADGMDHDVLKHCSFSVDGQVIERLTGDTLQILANSQPHLQVAREMDSTDGWRQPAAHVMVPLPFFFTHTTQDFFPILDGGRIRIECALAVPEDVVLEDVHLVFRGVFLDAQERREKGCGGWSKLFCHTDTQRHECGGNDAVMLRTLHSPVKDFQLRVVQRDDERDGKRCVTTIDRLDLLLNGHTNACLNRLMLTRVIPRKFYGVDANEARIHYLPVCQDPTNSRHPFTTSFDAGQIDCIQLLLNLDREPVFSAGMYTRFEVTVVTRMYNRWTLDADGKFTVDKPIIIIAKYSAATC